MFGAALAFAVGAGIALVACSGGGGTTATAIVATATVVPPATPPCSGAERVTPSQADDARFKAGSPERASLIEASTTGTRLTVAGVVLSTDCRPVAEATLDFWQADDSGAYDNVGFRLRGHQTTGPDGRYELETIVPGIELGRARHINVTVTGANHAPLTTRLYFAGDPSNAADPAFGDVLAMAVEQAGEAKVGGFDFVLR
jgi:protocatechuate 3,4-dioxygenase beta subunit